MEPGEKLLYTYNTQSNTRFLTINKEFVISTTLEIPDHLFVKVYRHPHTPVFPLQVSAAILEAKFADFDLSLLAVLAADNSLSFWDVKKDHKSKLQQRMNLTGWGAQFDKLKWDPHSFDRLLLYSKSHILLIRRDQPGREILLDLAGNVEVFDVFFVPNYPKHLLVMPVNSEKLFVICCDTYTKSEPLRALDVNVLYTDQDKKQLNILDAKEYKQVRFNFDNEKVQSTTYPIPFTEFFPGEVSPSKTVSSYDGKTNYLYVVIPKTGALVVKKCKKKKISHELSATLPKPHPTLIGINGEISQDKIVLTYYDESSVYEWKIPVEGPPIKKVQREEKLELEGAARLIQKLTKKKSADKKKREKPARKKEVKKEIIVIREKKPRVAPRIAKEEESLKELGIDKYIADSKEEIALSLETDLDACFQKIEDNFREALSKKTADKVFGMVTKKMADTCDRLISFLEKPFAGVKPGGFQ